MEIGWKPKNIQIKVMLLLMKISSIGIDLPEAKKISRYLLLQKRIAQIMDRCM